MAGDVSPPPTVDGARWSVRRLVLANLAVLSVAAGFLLVYRFAAALFLLFAGIALGMSVKPGVAWLRRHGVPRWASALGITALLGAAAAGVLLLVVPVVTEQVGSLIARAPRQLEEVRGELLSSSSRTLRRLAGALPARQLGRGGVEPATVEVAALAAYASALGRGAFAVAAVLLLGFYWTVEGDRRIRELVILAPLDRRRAVATFLAEIEGKVGAYLRGQAFVCGVIGILAFTIYKLIGLPYAATLGLVYALGEAVPVLGPIVGTSVAALVALSVGPTMVLWVLGAAVFLQLTEGYLLVPRVMDRTVGVSPLVTLLAITAFGQVLGVAGAVLAIPLAAIAQLFVDRFVLSARARRPSAPPGRDRVSALRWEVQELAVDVRKLLRLRGGREGRRGRGAAERMEDAVEGIAADLDRVLECGCEHGGHGERGERERGAQEPPP
jgi:predicted PurR-regulated permease PerM